MSFQENHFTELSVRISESGILVDKVDVTGQIVGGWAEWSATEDGVDAETG